MPETLSIAIVALNEEANLWLPLRWGLGFVAPLVLGIMAWQTAKIRSTQSATGILYVDFFTVVVGEVLAKYIVLATHVPV